MSQYGAYGYALHGATYQQILADYYRGTALSATNPRRIVKVLLQTGSATFSGATKAGAKKLKPGTTYSVQVSSNGSLALVSRSGKRAGTFAGPLTVSGAGPLTLAGLGTYRGSLEFLPAGGSSVETINAVGLDAYVRGVVASEMPSSWSPQALDAQAVAARTYALTSDVNGRAYQLYSDTRSQAYGGVGAEAASSNAAVAATRGQILTYNGSPAITYFFSSSGGYTESVQNAFPGATPEPWLVGVPDPYDGAGGDPYHHWSYRMSLAAAQAKLSGLVKGSLVGIKVLKHGVSPRILTAAVIGTGGSTTVTGIELQQRFGLLSTWARFRSVTTNSGTVPKTVRLPATAHSPDVSQITAETATALSVLVPEYFKPGVSVVSGDVFPAPRGSRLVLQVHERAGWRTVRRAAVGAAGRFVIAVPRAGAYRVVYGGLVGPSVNAG
jgi:stage II sporulation protein D